MLKKAQLLYVQKLKPLNDYYCLLNFKKSLLNVRSKNLGVQTNLSVIESKKNLIHIFVLLSINNQKTI